MAFKLTTQSPFNGETPDAYWKIIEININWLTKSAHVVISCFLNQSCRLEERQPITSRSYDWSGEDFPFTWNALDEEGNNAVKIAYGKIKSITIKNDDSTTSPGEFSEAENI